MDKRKATWVLTAGVREDVRECFRSEAALFYAMQTNAKTGSSILHGRPVKREKIKEFATLFLEFLKNFESGNISFDSSKFYDEDVRRAAQKYLKDDSANWKSICEEINPEEYTSGYY